MNASKKSTFRYAILFLAGALLGIVTLGSISASGFKNSLWQKLGLTSDKGGTLADTSSCTVPTSTEKDVYFVSCGGFF